ncbi:MAG: peptidylprolyl isomerase [Deltaproteobacteria bacterium]|nr:peptidylprolyl isomerase [Deltaproteobacteria bacterium]
MSNRARVGGLFVLAAVGVVGAGPLLAKGGPGKVVKKEAPASNDARLKGEAALKRIQELELQRGNASDVFQFMTSPEAAVRTRAALALGRLQDWTVVEPLVEYLTDPDVNVRKTTAFALGEFDPVMPLLVTQIKAGRKGDDPLVKGPALARAAAEKKLDARLHLEDRAEVRRALYTGLGPLAIGAGLHHLQFGLEAGEDEAAWAARALGVHGHRRRQEAVQDKEIMDALKKLLPSKNPDTRFGAVYALFRLSAAEVPLVRDALGTDTDARVRLYAARALAGRAGGEDALLSAMRDPDWRVRVEAVKALGDAPAPRGIANASDVTAVGAAAKDALSALLASSGLTNAPLAHVVVTAAGVLARAPPQLAGPQLDALAALVDVAPSGAAQAPGKTVATARKPEEYAAVRCAVARALDIVGGNPQRVLQCGPAGEPAWMAPARAMDVLAGMPGNDGERARRLQAYLHHADAHVRLKAADALAETDPVKAPDVGTLLAEQVGGETDPGAAFAMADGIKTRAVASMSGELRKALRRFAASPAGDHGEACVALVEALAACGVSDAIEDIKPLLGAPSVRLRRAAHSAISALGGTLSPLALRDPPFWPDPPASLPARATVKTTRGDVVLRFYRDDAPLTVTNFVKLARKGFYKNVRFHRVVPDFVVQGGDPRADGFGGPGHVIPCEYNPRPYERGVVGMALSGKDSGGSQFFITHSPQPHLDGNYTAFAEVEQGMEVVDALQVDDAILDVSAP